MSNRSEHLMVRNLFGQALSGEFQSSTDRSSRSHTMALLADATFRYGELVSGDGNLDEFYARPAWAEAVDARVFATRSLPSLDPKSFPSFARQLNVISLSYPMDQDHSLDIFDEVRSDMGNVVRLVYGSETQLLALDSDRAVTDARDLVAATAQKFFKSIF